MDGRGLSKNQWDFLISVINTLNHAPWLGIDYVGQYLVINPSAKRLGFASTLAILLLLFIVFYLLQTFAGFLSWCVPGGQYTGNYIIHSVAVRIMNSRDKSGTNRRMVVLF